MNEHIRIRRIIDGLRLELKSQEFGDEFRSLLANYNNACRQLKQRLSQVDTILLSGNRAGALQMAETNPSALDLLTLLGFTESQGLEEWCGLNGVTFEGKFDDQMIHRLNEAYSAGHESDADLERQYRKAVLKKDYASALPIARSIARLQPDNRAAQTELANTEKRYAKQLESKLEKALESKQTDKIRKLVGEFGNLNVEERVGGSALYEANQILQAEKNEQALEQICELLSEVPKSPSVDDWTQVECAYDQILELNADLTVELPSELASDWKDFSDVEQVLRKKVAKARSQKLALSKLSGVIDQVRADRVASRFEDLETSRRSLDSLLEAAKNAESLDVEIDDEMQARWGEEVTGLRAIVNAKTESARKKRLIASGVSIAALLVVGLSIFWFVRAKSIVDEAEEILADKNLSGARAFINAEYETVWVPFFSKRVIAHCDEIQQFIELDERNAVHILSELEALEATKELWASGITPLVSAHNELETLRAGVSELSIESAKPLKLEADRLKNEITVIKNHFEAGIVEDAEVLIKRMESDFLPRLRLSERPSALKQAIEEANASLAECSRIEARGEQILKLDEDQVERISLVKEAKEAAVAAVNAHEALVNELAEVQTVDAYYEFVSRDNSVLVKYPGSPLQSGLMDLPQQFNGDAFRKYAQENIPIEISELIASTKVPPLSPKTPMMSSEIDEYSDFRFNQMVDGIHLYEVTDTKTRKAVKMYSRGPIEEDSTVSTGRGKLRTLANGSIYFSNLYPNKVVFTDYEKVSLSNLLQYGVIPEWMGIEALGLGNILSNEGEITTTRSNPAPFLRAIDELRSNRNVSADYRCYALAQLLTMMDASGRPEQWGLSYLPDWERELKHLKAVGVQNGDWLRLPGYRKLDEAEVALHQFFDGLSVEKYAIFNQTLVESLKDTEIHYHGYLDKSMGKKAIPENTAMRSLCVISDLDRNKWISLRSEEDLNRALDFSPILSTSPSFYQICEATAARLKLSDDEVAVIYSRLGLDAQTAGE